jgi:hypothetical protein
LVVVTEAADEEEERAEATEAERAEAMEERVVAAPLEVVGCSRRVGRAAGAGAATVAVARAAVEQPAAAPVARTAAVAVREAARRGALPEALEAVPRAASLALEVEADSSVPNRVGRWTVAGRFVQY